MTDLRLNLSRLGLAQYVQKLSEEGFESWETVLEITESDLYGPFPGTRNFANAPSCQRGFRGQTWP